MNRWCWAKCSRAMPRIRLQPALAIWTGRRSWPRSRNWPGPSCNVSLMNGRYWRWHMLLA